MYQVNLKRLKSGLGPIGLRLNVSDSLTLSLVPSGRDKKIKVDTSHTFHVVGDLIRPRRLDKVCSYFGLNFEGKRLKC